MIKHNASKEVLRYILKLDIETLRPFRRVTEIENVLFCIHKTLQTHTQEQQKHCNLHINIPSQSAHGFTPLH